MIGTRFHSPPIDELAPGEEFTLMMTPIGGVGSGLPGGQWTLRISFRTAGNFRSYHKTVFMLAGGSPGDYQWSRSTKNYLSWDWN